MTAKQVQVCVERSVQYFGQNNDNNRNTAISEVSENTFRTKFDKYCKLKE
jgi:hypothetical protein